VDIFRILSYLSAAAVYLLIVIGGYVTSTGSGTACPDWPLCQGQILPPLNPYILIELTHRFATLLVGVLVVATGAVAWTRARSRRPSLVFASLSVILLFSQILLGMLTVRTGSSPLVVTAHLALATALFASVLVNAIYSSRRIS